MNIKELTDIMLRLCREALSGGAEPTEALPLDEVTLEQLYALSSAHDMAHLLSYALYRRGALNVQDGVGARFYKAQLLAVYRAEQHRVVSERLYATLEEAGVSFIPLKGAVLRALYPEGWMRTSCDIDLLVQKEDVARVEALLSERLSFVSQGALTEHDCLLISPEGVHLELHHTLIEDREGGAELCAVLDGVSDRAQPEQGYTYRRLMSDEDFYFYHVAHIAKHFRIGGCGARALLDTYLLLLADAPSKEATKAQLEKGGLAPFAKALERLARVWFGDEEHDEVTVWMADYILRGGVYGNVKTLAQQKSAAHGGSRARYLLARLFLSRQMLITMYPALKKRPWLAPYYQVCRWLRILLRGTWRRGSAADQMREVLRVDRDKAELTAQMLARLELK